MSYGPKILHEWQFAGYCVRIAEDEPGIVHFEQAKCEGELWEWKFERTEKPMGDANEIIQLSLALRDVEAERDEARRELAEAEEAIRFVSFGDGYDCYRNQDDPDRGRIGYTGTQGVWFEYPKRFQPAVRRAMERVGVKG